MAAGGTRLLECSVMGLTPRTQGRLPSTGCVALGGRVPRRFGAGSVLGIECRFLPVGEVVTSEQRKGRGSGTQPSLKAPVT